MNNEPVAWMLLRNEVCVELTEWFGVMRGWEEFLGDNEKIVELYTHPVKELTHEEYDSIFANGKRLGVIETENRLWKAMQLTDEEIHQAIRRGFSREGFLSDGIFLEIKELLRKAQER